MTGPLVTAVAMGYGHLRAAQALADALGVEVAQADLPPFADPGERRLWVAARRLYEATSRGSQLGALRLVSDRLLALVTGIPHLHPRRDLSAPDRPTRLLARLIERGLAHGLIEHWQRSGGALVTTYFATALAADAASRDDRAAPPIWCVATDSDLARVWVARDPVASRVRYLVPSGRALRRLRAYGVPAQRVEITGYPLPAPLVEGPAGAAPHADLARRLARLDPRGSFRESATGPALEAALGAAASGHPTALVEGARATPLHLVYAVGGAGAQTGIARQLLQGLAGPLARGELRLTLAAGTRPEVAARFARWARAAGSPAVADDGGRTGVAILFAAGASTYFERFHHLLTTADVLWTKPSELTFFAATGLPLVLAPPVGVQEVYNRRWAIEHGAGLAQRDPFHAAEWLAEWLADGTLAGAAWNGFARLPRHGTARIVERVRSRIG